MTEAVEPGTPEVEPEEAPEAGVPAARVKPGIRRLVPGRRGRRVAAGAAAVLVLGGAVAITAAVVHHGDRGFAVRAFPGGPEGIPGGGPYVVKVPGGVPGGPDRIAIAKGEALAGVVAPGAGVGGAAPQGQLAPAPLPGLAADQAVLKATAAVTGGKVASLQSVPEQGGGSAWEATVVGPDGVHHLVTLDGASGTVTGNTVIGG
ncbi:hypothetical protein [Streptacidiphilus rugosus]|uniref:hypothetical protein n=1 Tax=Streptacidiphilus rugosus TaxID=405783 RepID=UPI00055F514E|nr:hypothetical protein [Streptacidiphilus rugosus]